MINELIKIYDRDIQRLRKEIELFNEDSNLWRTVGHVKNPAGNLCLHLVGNLNTYIGKNLGYTNYVRDRDAEFNSRNVSKQELLDKVEETREVVISTMKKLNNEDVDKKYVEDVFGYGMTNGFFLIHLAAHLSYHLGQVNYIRRILE